MSIIEGERTQASTSTAQLVRFPTDFLWGAATASYQIEGAINEDGRGESIWDMFAEMPGKTYQGHSGEIAADHYHRMPEDVELMAHLGLGAYRFSIAWPRILPEGKGTVNEKGLDFYERLVDNLLARGITPFVTLYHWDLPMGLQDQGGWLNRDTAYAYADYAEIVVRRLGDRVNNWITHNEPWCSAFLGHGIGIHAPGMQGMQLAVIVAHHLLLSHGLALPRIRAHIQPGAQVGITLNLTPAYAADDHPATLQGVEQEDRFSNRWFLDPIFRGSYPEGLFQERGVQPPPIQDGDMQIISTPIDFLGINNYTRTVIRARRDGTGYEFLAPVPGACYTEMGWEIYPQSLTDLLCRVQREYAPKAIFITENGAAFNDTWDGGDAVHDPQRVSYLQRYIQAVGKALEQGVPIKGYFAWSLLDNYEWAEGYSKRFGIVYVDYPTQKRIIKDSGRWYSSFIASQQR